MGQWRFHLDLKDLWKEFNAKGDAASKDPGAVKDLGKSVAERIRKSPFFRRFPDPLEDITQRFELAVDIEEVDDILSELYDWADQERCWVATF